MPEQANGGIRITLEGSHLKVDARPARLVSQLLGTGADPTVTAHGVDGAAHTQSLPGPARQSTFRIRDDVTVEATRAADFVAIAEDSGRCVVVALRGEVTVLPRGSDRFALGAHEALVVPAGEGNPRVVVTDSLSESDRAEVDAVLDAAVDAVFSEPAAVAEPEAEPVPEPERTQPVAAATLAPAAAAAAAPGKKGQAKRSGPSKAAGQRKKGKKGRPQPRPQKAGAAKKTAAPTAKVASAPPKAAAGGGTPTKPPAQGGGGGGGGGGHDDGSYDDTPRDRRLMALLVVGALAVLVVLILVLSGGDDGEQEVSSGATTTTEASEATTTTAAGETTTTAAPAATTTTAAPASTTTARPATTTTAAPATKPDYAIEPKSCVQNGTSVTYTGNITNNASEAFDFVITVVLKDTAGKEIGTAQGTVTNLASKRSADFTATARNVSGTPAACDVSRVQADPSD